MSQLISTRLAITLIAVFAWGVGYFLLQFNEKVTNEMTQSNLEYQNMINNQSLEMRKNISNKASANLKK